MSRSAFWISEEKELYTGAFLREDTLQRKVYILVGDIYANNFGFEGKEFLHYDFNLELGDTLFSEYHGNPVVQGIFAIPDNTNRSFYEMTGGLGYFNYTEEFGSDAGLFGISYDIHPVRFETICHMVKNEPVVRCRGNWTKNEQVISKDNGKLFSIHQHNRVVSINTEYPDITMRLVTMEGKCILETLLTPGETLDINVPKKGIYIISAYNSGFTKEHSEMILIN